MPFIILIVGIVLVVAAIRDTQSSLFTALANDIPAFGTWFTAILVLGAIGFISPLKPLSKALLILVLVVLVLRNYQSIIAGFNNAWQSAGSGAKASGSGSGGPPARGRVTVSDAGFQANNYASVADGSAFSHAYGVL